MNQSSAHATEFDRDRRSLCDRTNLQKKYYISLVCVFIVLAGCGGGSDPEPPRSLEPSSVGSTSNGDSYSTAEVTSVPECQIQPSATAASIDNKFGNHCVYHAGGNPQKLFVFLGASSSNPSSYTLIGKAAAAAGLHSIGLAYANSLKSNSTVQGACNSVAAAQPASSPQCTGDIREEQLLGNDTSAYIEVNPDNSLNNRLYRLLVYLNTNFPGEHWSNFIVGGAVRWTMVSIGGLSQGSGLAGYTGKRKGVGRVCMLSGPADFDNADPSHGIPAAWVSSKLQTSPSLMYAFDSTRDNVVDYSTNAVPNWNALGLTGPDTNVDSTQPPYNSSHRLTTSLNVGSAHTSTAKDDTTPMTSPVPPATATPIYAPVWNYACFQ